ncbi:MAG: ABC transporter permease [Anaerolineae bacterium]|nr:ABC transporter permease [Anaerolineae bacterium]
MKDILHRIWSIVVKEVLQLSRDKVLMGFVILAPLLELALMANMVGDGAGNLPMAIVDKDLSRASRELVVLLDQSDDLRLEMRAENIDQARQAMQQGKVAAIVVVPPGYGKSLNDPRQGAELQVIVDDSNYVVALVAESGVKNVAAEITQDLATRMMNISGGPVKMSFVARFNATLDDRPRSITAMLGLIIYQVTLIIAAQSFTRERERGTLEQLRITPLGRVELIVGKAIPTLAIGLVDGMLMIGLIAMWFEVPIHGSLPLLLSLFVPFILAQIGWGTLISLVSHNQQQAVLFVFALAMLEVACSGFIVPAADMPKAMQIVSYASSVQHFLVILRGVMLRGAGFSSVWVPSLALTGIALAATALAWLRLRAGLDADSLRQRLRAARQRSQVQRRRRTVPSVSPSRGKPKLAPQPVYATHQRPVRRRRRS